MLRNDTIYATGAAVMLGLALHDAGSAFFVLVTKYYYAKKTAVFVISAITWMFLSIYISLHLITIDYIAAPPILKIVTLENGYTVYPEPFAYKWIANVSG